MADPEQLTMKSGNRYSISEWAGAAGDLGTILPLAFALVIFNGFSPHRLFFLWGLVFVATGLYFRIPISVQPLKAMVVIAIAAGFGTAELATTAFFFGLLILLLSVTGFIRVLQRWFTQALVRGIQLGIGLILLQKAYILVRDTGFHFGSEGTTLLNLALTAIVIVILGIFQLRLKLPVSIVLLVLGIGISILLGVRLPEPMSSEAIVRLQLPETGFFWSAIFLLIIPQLPLTLGNSIYAASDACHSFWPERSGRVSPTSLGTSIGVSNLLIGIAGGFPVCHGAGGMAAYAKFGGRTGGTTVIIGSILIVSALVKPAADLLFYIPIPLLGALLAIASWGLIILVRNLENTPQISTAIIVGLISLITRNLAIAVLSGIVIEYLLGMLHKQRASFKGENP